MDHKGPVKLLRVDGSHVHPAGVPFHEHRSQRHRLSDQFASDEFQTKSRVLGFERNLRREAAFADLQERQPTRGKNRARFRDCNARLTSDHKLLTEVLLELGKRSAERRLGQAKLLRRAIDAPNSATLRKYSS